MADKTTGELAAVSVGDLPAAPDIYDDFKMPGEFQGEAVHVTGSQMKEYAVASVSPIANAAAVSAAEASLDAAAAKTSAAASEGAKTAAQSALYGVQSALNNIPAGSTLVINDLTTGGTSAALSAEMGKMLNDNKLDKGGGAMLGVLSFANSSNANGGAIYNDPGANGGGLALETFANYSTKRQLLIANEKEQTNVAHALRLGDWGTGKWYNVLHEGNKPSGEYTGNETIPRVIYTGGLGDFIAIRSMKGDGTFGGFFLMMGEITIRIRTTGEVLCHDDYGSFLNGVLTLNHTNLNGSTPEGSLKYTYQVL